MASSVNENRLINSNSPYLLQHAHNPVDWYPWGDEALARAVSEHKPIFLSIGYSACHWCHVMERESFEDNETARLMNENFVCIKVDREERPDLDEFYMNSVQLMTGSGGWPLTVFLTPDLRPYFGGTYFPPEDLLGRPSFRAVLKYASTLFRERRKEIEELGEDMMKEVGRLSVVERTQEQEMTTEIIDRAEDVFSRMFDATWGGFGNAPKFPPTNAIDLLLRCHHRKKGGRAIQMATVTLDRMAYGGIRDQLSGGFHRYSTDQQWKVPHFEKMLYDNALLASNYIDGFRVAHSKLYGCVATETLDFAIRAFLSPDGGFMSAIDADSEGVEGKYYVWNKKEIVDVLGRDDAELFCQFYGVRLHGDLDGENVLHARVSEAEFAEGLNIPLDEFAHRMEAMRRKVLDARNRRVPPLTDDKILTDWNGLMISALAHGFQVFGDDRHKSAALRAAKFILDECRPNGKLLHSYRAGRGSVPAMLDDYAFLLRALVDLYETTFDANWITVADSLATEMIQELWDDAGGFYFAPLSKNGNLPRSKTAHDGAVPSGNAVAIQALLRLARLCENPAYFEKGRRSLEFFLPNASKIPNGFTRLLCALDDYLAPRLDITVAGDPARAETRELIKMAWSKFLPSSVKAHVNPLSPASAAVVAIIPMLQGKEMLNGVSAAYVCENEVCRNRITNPDELGRLLDKR